MGSMEIPECAQYHAVRASMMIQRACELTGTPFEFITFNQEHHRVSTPDAKLQRVMIARIASGGTTRLAPALRTAVIQPPQKHERHLILVYCDGILYDSDAQASRHVVKAAGNDTVIVPVMIGNEGNVEQFRSVFDRVLEVRNFADLPKLLRSYVRNEIRT
jgi:hypothetical protein